jgi:hypothetical protein
MWTENRSENRSMGSVLVGYGSGMGAVWADFAPIRLTHCPETINGGFAESGA